jgi:hypothetical protein
MKTKQLILTIGILILISLVSLASVQAMTIKSVDVFPGEIGPGETATISMILENTLNQDVEDISVSLNFVGLPFAPYGSSNEASIEELSENEDETISFKVKALTDAESRIYQIPVKITYYDEDGDPRIKDSLIGITVNSEPIIGANTEDGLLLKGQENEVTVKVVNKGLSDVKFLEVELQKGTYHTILSQKNIYIGDIDSDDFDSADFKVFFKGKTPSTVNLIVRINYKDALNNEYSEDFALPLRVYTREQAIQLGLLQKSRTTTYVGVVVVLIIVWFVYRKIKKRRKMKKAQSSA